MKAQRAEALRGAPSLSDVWMSGKRLKGEAETKDQAERRRRRTEASATAAKIIPAALLRVEVV